MASDLRAVRSGGNPLLKEEIWSQPEITLRLMTKGSTEREMSTFKLGTSGDDLGDLSWWIYISVCLGEDSVRQYVLYKTREFEERHWAIIVFDSCFVSSEWVLESFAMRTRFERTFDAEAELDRRKSRAVPIPYARAISVMVVCFPSVVGISTSTTQVSHFTILNNQRYKYTKQNQQKLLPRRQLFQESISIPSPSRARIHASHSLLSSSSCCHSRDNQVKMGGWRTKQEQATCTVEIHTSTKCREWLFYNDFTTYYVYGRVNNNRCLELGEWAHLSEVEKASYCYKKKTAEKRGDDTKDLERR